MNKLELYTTQGQFEGLHKDVDGTRASNKRVAVERQAIVNLLMDHAKLLEAVGRENYVFAKDKP